MLLFLILLLQLLITIMMNWGTHDKIRGASHVLEGRTSSSSSSALHMHFFDEVLGALLYPRALFLDTYSSLSLESPLRESRNHNLLPFLVPWWCIGAFRHLVCYLGFWFSSHDHRMKMGGRRHLHSMKRFNVGRKGTGLHASTIFHYLTLTTIFWYFVGLCCWMGVLLCSSEINYYSSWWWRSESGTKKIVVMREWIEKAQDIKFIIKCRLISYLYSLN